MRDLNTDELKTVAGGLLRGCAPRPVCHPICKPVRICRPVKRSCEVILTTAE